MCTPHTIGPKLRVGVIGGQPTFLNTSTNTTGSGQLPYPPTYLSPLGCIARRSEITQLGIIT